MSRWGQSTGPSGWLQAYYYPFGKLSHNATCCADESLRSGLEPRMADRPDNATHPWVARGSTHRARKDDQVSGGPAANGRAVSSFYSRLSPGETCGGRRKVHSLPLRVAQLREANRAVERAVSGEDDLLA